jgi:hypothetical protein
MRGAWLGAKLAAMNRSSVACRGVGRGSARSWPASVATIGVSLWR